LTEEISLEIIGRWKEIVPSGPLPEGEGRRKGGREGGFLTVLSVTTKTVRQLPPRESRRMEVMTLFR
jgi:hypothetical protein